MKIKILILLFLFGYSHLFAQPAIRDSLLKVIQTSAADTNKANALYDLSFSYVNSSPDSVLFYGEQALELSKKISYQKGIANAYYALGAGNFRKGDIKKAERYFNDCAGIAKKTGNKTLAIKAYIGLGNSNYVTGEIDTAIECWQKGVLVAEEINDLPRLATLLNNIGNLNSLQERRREAISYYNKSLRISYQLKDTGNLALASSNLAENYRVLEVLDSARLYADSALFFAEKINDLYTQSLMWGALGLIEFKLKNYDGALPYLRKSLASFKTKGNKAEAGELLNALGQVYFHQNKIDSALYYHIKAKELAEVTGHNDHARLVYEGLSLDYAAKKDFKNAYDYLYKYLVAQNKFLDSLNIRNVTELNAKYESVSRQRKIDLLEKDKEIQKANLQREKIIRYFLISVGLLLIVFSLYTYYRYKQRRKLSEKLSESLDNLKQAQQQLIETERQREQENVRLRISRDIHDEIGGNLTKIALLSDVVSSETKTNGSETKQSLEKISEYARNVNTSLSEIVWSVNPKQDTLESLIAYMRNYIHSFLSDTGINFTINFPELPESLSLNPDLKRNIFLVLKESLNNCVKYSGAKNIEVTFSFKENKFELLIRDDGVGFDHNSKFRNGNGLNNMTFRMDQLGCKLDITTSRDKGCIISAHGKI
ncbi:MAG TPA: tetratricopeptide repeat protein [Bacteroidia bacterium]|nr:tetratricopeptide repeat protein [Bacteroidia bacterium]